MNFELVHRSYLKPASGGLVQNRGGAVFLTGGPPEAD